MDPIHELSLGPRGAGAHRGPGPPPGTPRRGAARKTARVAASSAIALALIAAAGCVSVPKGVRHEEQSRLSMDLAPQTRIVVDNARGSVRLQPSDSFTLHVEARKRVLAITEEAARELARRVRVEVLRAGEELKLVVRYPANLSSSHVRVRVLGRELRRPRADVDLVISVPLRVPVKVVSRTGDLVAEGTTGPLEFWTSAGDASLESHTGKVTVRSTSGDASVGRLEGAFEMNTSSGDLRAGQVSGPLALQSTSGDLIADRVDGDLTVSTASGDVSADLVRGACRVSTSSGDVKLGSASGRLDVATASGDVSAGIDAALERVSIETTSGDVSLRVPESAQGRLEIVTASGDVVARVPMVLEQATRRRLVGVMGPGKASVAVHTTSGDIHVVGPANKR